MADCDSTIVALPKRRWPRRMGVVVGFLLAGAIINVLVALGVVALPMKRVEFLPRPIALMDFLDNREWTFISHERRFGLDRLAIFEAFHESELELERTSQYLQARLNGEDLHERIIDFPSWSRLGTSVRDPFRIFEHEVAAGWPIRALWGSQYEIHEDPTTGNRTRNYDPPSSLRINRWTIPKFGVLPYNDRQLPLIPIWPGFLINTVFYGAIAWLLFATPRAVRRRRRVKKRQCPACAYPIGTNSVCTECGKGMGETKFASNGETK